MNKFTQIHFEYNNAFLNRIDFVNPYMLVNFSQIHRFESVHFWIGYSQYGKMIDFPCKLLKTKSGFKRTKKIKPNDEPNFYKLSRLVYIMTRASGGMLPFSFHYNNNGELENVVVTIFDKIGMVITIGAYCLLIYLCVIDSLNDYITESSVLLYATMNFILCMGLAHGIFSICKNMIQRDKLSTILRDLNAFDEEMRSLGVKINYPAHKRLIIQSYVVMHTFLVIFIVITAYEYRSYHIPRRIFALAVFYLSYASASSILSGNMMIYLFKLVSVYHRFKLLNGLIRWHWSKFRIWNSIVDYLIFRFRDNFLNASKAQPEILDNWKAPDLARHFCRLHDRLCDVLDKSNACWSIQVNHMHHS